MIQFGIKGMCKKKHSAKKGEKNKGILVNKKKGVE